jgi:hypothetical protein
MVSAKSGDAVFTGIEHLLDHAGDMVVEEQFPLAYAGEKGFEPMGQRFHLAEIHCAGRSLQAVSAAERLIKFSVRRMSAGLRDQSQKRANLRYVLAVLDLERSQ